MRPDGPSNQNSSSAASVQVSPQSRPQTLGGQSSATPAQRAPLREDDVAAAKWAWYSRSWSRKSNPTGQPARANVSDTSDAAARPAAVPKSPKSLRYNMGNRKLSHASDRGTPAKVTTTAINVSSDGSINTVPLRGPSDEASGPAPSSSSKAAGLTTTETQRAPVSAQMPGDPQRRNSSQGVSASAQTNGLFSWISRKEKPAPPELSASTAEQVTTTSKSGVDEEHQPDTTDAGKTNCPNSASKTEQSDSRRSWFGLWPYGQAAPLESHRTTDEPPPSHEDADATDVAASRERNSTDDNTPDIFTPPASPLNSQGVAKSSGWAFWSRERSANASSISLSQEVGELAVTDTPSQQHPRRASIHIDDRPAEQDGPPTLPNGNVKISSALPLSPKSKQNAAHKVLQKNIPNLVLPSFEDTYKAQENLSMMRQFARYFNLYKPASSNKINRLREPTRIRKCLAVGVHGYFPAPLIRSVLGQPTGTSIKFANCAAQAIRRWSDQHGYDCSIEKVALEGEGRIAERVDVLWKLLLNWIEEITQADFILLACHSQGVPVTIMLVEKLLNLGCISSARIGICAMAGVNMGPFTEYKSRWISGSAGELFEFSNPLSKVSQDFRRSLAFVLESDVRVVLAGSIDDQLVSLESSLFMPAQHPYLYRAVFIDGRVHAPGFLTHLVGFALKLRNIGFSDHGLVRELSSPLAGSLYSGEGHSKLYEDGQIYDLGVQFALETSDITHTKLSIAQPESLAMSNPYILPFAMRGLLEEHYVKTELHEETKSLLHEFDSWHPSTKVLKDVKFRLEGIRSKL